MSRLDIDALLAKAIQFEKTLEPLKARLKAPYFDWYPYDSVGGNLTHIANLLTGDRRYLLDLIGDDPVLDLGCGDGSLAFFLESLGCKVCAIDYPATNYNGMLGIRALKQALHSSVEIGVVDLDAEFSLPGQRWGVVFCLGLLYHLKNPFNLLERLARCSRYCFASTRVARLTPDHETRLERAPVAYLLDQEECNHDATNYWVFSSPGFRRLLRRTRWEICDYLTVGNTSDSDPVSPDGDERAFCLARSEWRDQMAGVRLLRGWHALEQDGWRWTERAFAAEVKTSLSDACTLRLQFALPEILLARLGPVTIQARINETPLAPETYSQPGEQFYTRKVSGAGSGGWVRVEFQLDKALPPSESDHRELGIVVSTLGLF